VRQLHPGRKTAALVTSNLRGADRGPAEIASHSRRHPRSRPGASTRRTARRVPAQIAAVVASKTRGADYGPVGVQRRQEKTTPPVSPSPGSVWRSGSGRRKLPARQAEISSEVSSSSVDRCGVEALGRPPRCVEARVVACGAAGQRRQELQGWLVGGLQGWLVGGLQGTAPALRPAAPSGDHLGGGVQRREEKTTYSPELSIIYSYPSSPSP